MQVSRSELDRGVNGTWPRDTTVPSGTDAVELICGMREQMYLVITVLVTMGVLLGFSLLFVSPGDESFPILVLDLVLIAVSLLVFGGAYRYCTKRAMGD